MSIGAHYQNTGLATTVHNCLTSVLVVILELKLLFALGSVTLMHGPPGIFTKNEYCAKQPRSPSIFFHNEWKMVNLVYNDHESCVKSSNICQT